MDVFHYQIALSKRVNLGYFFHLYYLVGKTYYVVTIHKNRCFLIFPSSFDRTAKLLLKVDY